MWRCTQTGMCNYTPLGLWRDLLHIAGTSPASRPVCKHTSSTQREEIANAWSLICLLGQLCVTASFQAQMPTCTAASSTLLALAARGRLLTGQFLLLQAVGNAPLSGSSTALPPQLLLRGTALIWLILLRQLDLFLGKRSGPLSSPYYHSPTAEELRKKSQAKGSMVAEGARLSSLLTLSVLISRHPKQPPPKRSSPSETDVLLTSQSDMFLSASRCTSLIKAPPITTDAAKPELRQAVVTAQVLCGSPWIAGKLLAVRAEPTLFCRRGGQKD